MPKITRAAEEVIGIKDRILETALQHLIEDGFEHFSMRKLAARLGMTAANIYNYFTNKDELYLLIQTRGFEMLYNFLHEAYKRSATPEKKLETMIRAYLKFGMDNPEYYEIMFSRNTPKYADYKGTPMEKVALLEKHTALKSADITIQALSDLFMNNKTVHIDTIRFRMLQIWFTLNGMINLFNSRVLQEVEGHVDAIIKRMTQDIMKTIKLEGMDKL
jgi:AcrR family transcriptional regulator